MELRIASNSRGPGILVCLAILALGLSGCAEKPGNSEHPDRIPKVVLWAWERPENLIWLGERQDIGVAFLTQTLLLEKESFEIKRRRQPLKVPESTYLIAVTRIESNRSTVKKPVLSKSQRHRAVASILKSTHQKNVKAIQIDFDAAESEREFYRELLRDVRSELSDDFPLSMTALASWCAGDRWLEGVSVDEIVPMVFDLGTNEKEILGFLSAGNDWNEPRCRGSYGLAVYQPVDSGIVPGRRRYFFSRRPWRASDLKLLPGEKIQ